MINYYLVRFVVGKQRDTVECIACSVLLVRNAVQKYTDMALEALDVFENNEYMTELARSLTDRTV